MRNVYLDNNEVDRNNLMKHKKLLNSVSLKLEELEEENENLTLALEKQQELVMNFF